MANIKVQPNPNGHRIGFRVEYTPTNNIYEGECVIFDWMIEQKGSLERCVWLITVGEEDADTMDLLEWWVLS